MFDDMPEILYGIPIYKSTTQAYNEVKVVLSKHNCISTKMIIILTESLIR